MSRDICRYPTCDDEPSSNDDRDDYRTGSFCSLAHDIKYDHIKMDAESARRSEERR